MISDHDPLLGTILNRYKIIEFLGGRGPARVYKGIHIELNRSAAIKVIDCDLPESSDFAKRLRQETLALVSLRHTNIVQIIDFGQHSHGYYVVMEYIDGDDLAVQMRQYKVSQKLLPKDHVIRIIKDVASALDYAHSRNIIHQNVKPTNILINRENQLLLTDFDLVIPPAPASLTTLGRLFGPWHYVAPEQAMSSSDAVKASDIYSLGVILYEMVTGQLPFDDELPLNVVLKHINDEPLAPTQINPALPPEVETVILKALAKSPADRFAAAGDMAAALQNGWQDDPLPTVEMPKTTAPDPPAHNDVATIDPPSPEDILFTPFELPPDPVELPESKRFRHGRLLITLVGLVVVVLVGAFMLLPLNSHFNASPGLEVPPTSINTVAGALVEAATPTPWPSDTPALTPTPTVRLDSSLAGIPSPSPGPTMTVTPAHTPTPLPTLKATEQHLVSVSAQSLLLIMIMISVVFTAGTVFNPVQRRHIWLVFHRITEVNVSILTGLGFMLLILGLWKLFRERDAQAASIAFLAGWLLISEDFYAGITGPSSSWLVRAMPLFLLGFGYGISWYGFSIIHDKPGFGTVCIFGVGIIFSLGISYKEFNPVLRARLADDLFLMTLIFVGVVLIPTMFPDYSNRSSTDLIGSAGWYMYVIGVLARLVNQVDGGTVSRRKIPVGVVRFVLYLVGIVLIVQAIYHVFAISIMYQASIPIADTTIHLALAMVGVFILLLTNARSPDQVGQFDVPATSIQGSTKIKVPPDQIMGTLLDVAAAPEWTPNLKEVKDIHGRGVGCTYRWQYKMGLLSFKGKTEIIEAANNRFVMKTTGGIPSTWIWILTPTSKGWTDLQVTIEYIVPGQLGGSFANNLLVKSQNKKAMTRTLANLKKRLEK
jgi:serine/threonine protein kinase